MKPGALLTILLCFALLFIPGPDTQGDRFLVFLQDFAHVPLFAGITFLLLSVLGRRITNGAWRSVAAIAFSLAIGVIAEFIQPFVGRTAGIRDVVLGISGSVAAVCAYWVLRSRSSSSKVLLLAAAGLLVISAAWPMLLIAQDRRAARRHFPRLASFESRTELGRWSVNGCKISRVPSHTTHGHWALKIEVENPDSYPGLFESDSVRNVADIKQLCFDVFVPGEGPVKIWLRMDDRVKPAYSDRFQDLRTLFPGTNTLCIERATLASTPSGRPLDLGRILSWGIFFDAAKAGETLYLDNVRVLTK